METLSQPKHHKSTTVSQAIETDIVNGVLLPGDRLSSEDELCEQFGVSRTVIREAIHRLKAREIICSIKGSGSYVTEFGQEHLRSALKLYSALATNERSFLELMDLRVLVEADCAKRLAKSQGKKALARVKSCLHMMKRHQNDFKKFGEADIDFHLAIVGAVNNELYATILDGLLKNVGKRFAHLTYNDKRLVKKNYGDHLAIYAAIVKGDPTAAAAAMRKHLLQSKIHLIDLLADAAKQCPPK